VGYGEIQRNIAGYSWRRTDTAGYSVGVGYNSGIQWICCKIASWRLQIYRDTVGYQLHGEIQAGYRLNTGGTGRDTPKNTR